MINEEIPLHLVMNENPLSDEEDNYLVEENNDQENAGNGILNAGAVIIIDEFIANPASLTEFWLIASDSSLGKKVAAQTQWAPLFTSMLLSPSNYKWVKSFIQSKAWEIFSKGLSVTTIKIPNQCPSQELPCIKKNLVGLSASLESDCPTLKSKNSASLLTLPQPENSSSQSPVVASKKGKKARVVLVETKVRRSPKLKLNNKGFKANSCNSKNCLGCNPNPQDLTSTMIKKLGTSCYQIDENVD